MTRNTYEYISNDITLYLSVAQKLLFSFLCLVDSLWSSDFTLLALPSANGPVFID